MNQTTIFDMMYQKYKITKPIRLIELFGGYGSQALALKYLGVEFEHWKLVEWAIKSIQAYKDIHFTDSYTNLVPSNAEKEPIVDFLYQVGISANYNEPMTKEQINRLSYNQVKTILENIFITHNLVNIQQVKGKDLEIVDTDKYDYILTYSFPCQDLSLAGKGKGMSDTSTRSGMLWEVERILTECKELGSMPSVLLLENVPQVHSVDNMPDFHKWQVRLEELGYKSYWQDLIATDYGIPQTRNRCFMVSILGDYSYTFPQPIPLKLKLKDMLEDNVDEKYYLSDKTIKYISAELGVDNKLHIKNATKQGYLEATDGDGVDISGRMEYHRGTVQKGLTQTLSTMGGENNGVVVKPKVLTGFGKVGSTGQYHQQNRVYDDNVAISVTTSFNPYYATKENTLKKDLCNKLIQDGLVEEGDVVKHSYTQQIMDGNKKCVEKNDGNMITLTTRGDCVGVCVGTYQYAKSDNFMQGKDRLQLGKETSDTLQTTQKEGVVVVGNYSPSNHNASRVVDQEHSAPTVMENHGTITAIIDKNNKNAKHQQDMIQDANGNARTLVCGTHGNGGHYTKTLMNDLRIRKLTPRECFRLMGVKDEDYDKVCKNQSDASLYHLSGDSIVVNVLMAIFKELL